MSNKSLPKVKIVQLDSGPVEIKKLPLGRYSLLLQKLEKVPELLDGITKLDSDNTGALLAQIRDLIVNSSDEVIGILSAATGVDEETLSNEVDLEGALDLVLAVIEVNNFLALKGKFLKVFAGKGKKEVLQAQAAAGYSK